MTTTADAYILQVLERLPRAMPRRDQIALELRGHIAEALERGQPLEEILAQLGDPARLADSYLAAVPLVSAPLGPRIVAKLVDVACICTCVVLPTLLAWLVLPPEAFPFALVVAGLVGGFGFLLYTVFAEASLGRTYGKRVAGLQVVRESGGQISLGQSVVRQLPLMLQFFWVDVLFVLFTDRRQRAFELLSKTRVVLDGGEADGHA